jgi:branched-chain amino acid transport system permease protein
MLAVLRHPYGRGLPLVSLLVIPVLFHSNDYVLTVAIYALLLGILAIGTSLLMGHAGQISIGQAGFYAVGAYASALLTTRLELPVWLGFGAAVAVSALAGYALGLPALRLRGHYLAMVTVAFAQLVYEIALNWPDLTGGPNGVVGIPRPSLGGLVFDNLSSYFVLVFIVLLVAYIFARNIVDSRTGRALRTLQFTEQGAKAVGIDVAHYKVQVFALSGAYMGLAGALYAHFINYIGPESFTIQISIQVLAMSIFGGMTSITGAVVGSLMLTVLQEVVKPYQRWDLVVYSIIIIGTMIVMPRGVVPAAAAWWEQMRNGSGPTWTGRDFSLLHLLARRGQKQVAGLRDIKTRMK